VEGKSIIGNGINGNMNAKSAKPGLPYEAEQ
jgi:hypothetical protein